MLITESTEKQQKMINTWANKNIFLKGEQRRTQSFFGYTSVYSYWVLSGTEESSPWLEALPARFLKFRVSTLA